MAYIDENLSLCDGCCESCGISNIGTKIDTLIADITAEPQSAYSGDQLENSEIELLNSMCEMANRTQLGTVLDEILVASENYTDVSEMSDADKNLLNAGCETFRINAIGTKLQSAILTVNEMASYDESDMLTFSIHGITGATGAIGASAIAIDVPYGTDLSDVICDFTSSGGSTVTISAVEQVSGTTHVNLTSPKVYRVTSYTEDAHTDYTCTVTVLENTQAILSAFAIGAATGTIDQEAKTVTLEVANGVGLVDLVATFTASDNAVVTVGGVTQESSVTTNTFTSPVSYVVTSEDTLTENTYVITVTEAAL